jgi:hypothetical protein
VSVSNPKAWLGLDAEMTMRIFFAVIVATILVIVSAASLHFGDVSFLRAEYSVEKADIGIPGISKMYDARLTNRGAFPIHIQVCDFVTDASAPGDAVAFSVQRWDRTRQEWTTITDASDAANCRPYPLGWATAELKDKWLWPGQSVSMGEEATAARGFRKGDSARFVLYSGFTARQGTVRQAFPTAPFEIDEELSQEGQGLRIRH